jgi:hypothetical protein
VGDQAHSQVGRVAARHGDDVAGRLHVRRHRAVTMPLVSILDGGTSGPHATRG